MKFCDKNGTWWVHVNYHLVDENGAAKCFDDSFDLRLAGDFEKMSAGDRVEALLAAGEEFARRHPDFELCKADSARAFLEQTKGYGVLWFHRKPRASQS